MRKKVTAVLIVLLLMFLNGCTIENTEYSYDTNSTIGHLESGVVAENSNYVLEWNNEKKYIALTGKQTGTVWSSIPQAFLNSDLKGKTYLAAPLNISVFNKSDKSVTNISGYSYAVSSGRVESKRIKNGVRVTYYFDKYRVSIPVEYTLSDRSLDVLLNPDEIVENDFQVVSVSLLPYMCSAKNNTEDSYLFVPSGSGAIMNCYQFGDEGRTYSGNVYGVDKARILVDPWFSETAVKLPVFGVKIKDSALFGVVKSYSGALIEANAGDVVTGFSSVHPTFELRGYDEMETRGGKYIKYSDSLSTGEAIKLSYYILEGEDSGYESMASVYRDYLIKEYSMQKTGITGDVLLKFYGGDYVNRFIAGIPQKRLTVLTKYSDVQKITEELVSKTGIVPILSLVGFTKNGLGKGVVGGGFSLDKTFGGKKELDLLKNYVSDKDGTLFADFDIVNFSKSGKGYSVLFSAAKTANRQRMSIGSVTIDVHTKKNNVPEYYLLRRDLLDSAASDLSKSLNSKGISAVSLESLGKTAYSDYESTKYYTKGNITTQVSRILSKYKSNGTRVLLSDANDYAASVCDAVTDVSLDSGNYSVFDATVPFYQMVFSGYKQLFSKPVNEQSNITDVLLDAVATGTGISVSITNSYDTKLSTFDSAFISKSVYSGNKDAILSVIKRYKDFSQKRGDAALISYTISDNGLIKSKYDNGMTVYTNRTDSDLQIDDVAVPSKDYIVKGGK